MKHLRLLTWLRRQWLLMWLRFDVDMLTFAERDQRAQALRYRDQDPAAARDYLRQASRTAAERILVQRRLDALLAGGPA